MKRLKIFLILLSLLLPGITWANNIIIAVKDNNKSREVHITSEIDFQLAALVHNDKLLLVVDHSGEVTFNAGITNFKNYFLDKGQLITYDLIGAEKFEITAFKKNKGWLIKIIPYDNSILDSELVGTRNMRKNINSEKSQLEIANFASNAKIISFTDPVSGEKIITIPEATVVRNNLSTFIDFQILPSLVGLIIVPLNDHLLVKNVKNSTIISSSTYLNLSNHNFNLEDMSNLFYEPKSILASYLLDRQQLQVTLEALRQEAILTPDVTHKSYSYLKLVQFLFSQGFYMEAKSLLAFVKTNLISSYYQVRLLVAALYFMNNNLEEAYDLLQHLNYDEVELENQQEIKFWQSFSKIAILNAQNADNIALKTSSALEIIISSLMNETNNFLQFYSPQLLLEIKLQLLEIASHQGNKNLGQIIIKFIEKHSLSSQDKKRLAYNKALLLILDEKNSDALTLLENCGQDPLDNYYYSHCNFQKLEILKKENKIDMKDLINQLQALSVLWRGDKFEFTILNRLVTLYLEMNDLANAMRILQIIKDHDPHSPLGLKATSQARKLFIEYFQSYSSDNPLNQLAFFYEFQDFIPVGDLGDKIILQVAQSMLDLNLLDSAIQLMDFQVKNRLIGINKDKILNKLIMTYQAKGENKEVIKLVEDFTTFPIKKNNPLLQERYKLYIKSLIAIRQYEDALALLYEDTSLEGDQLRAQVLAEMGDWDGFHDNSEPYLYSIRYQDNHFLTEEDKMKILQQNIAYFHTGQGELLEKLFADFKKKMKKGDKLSEANKIFYLLAKELNYKNSVGPDIKNKVTNLLMQLLDLA